MIEDMEEIGIESSMLQQILSGEKTVEGRLGKSKFLKMKVGDKLVLREDVWRDGAVAESIPNLGTITIKQLLYFESFEEMLDAIDFHDVIPNVSTKLEALNVYRQFYSLRDETEYGVVAIMFSLEKF